MRNGRTRWATLAVVVLALALCACQPTTNEPPPSPNTSETDVSLPDAKFQMANPTLEQQDEQGKVIWRLQARLLEAESKENRAQGILTEVRGTLYREGKPVLRFTAERARADSETRIVEAWGNVRAQSLANNAQMRAGRIRWDSKNDRIRASDGVQIVWDAFELQDNQLNVDTALERVWGD